MTYYRIHAEGTSAFYGGVVSQSQLDRLAIPLDKTYNQDDFRDWCIEEEPAWAVVPPYTDEQIGVELLLLLSELS